MLRLSALKNLEQIRLFVFERIKGAELIIDAAQKVLEVSSQHNRRLDVVFYDTGKTRTITFDNVT